MCYIQSDKQGLTLRRLVGTVSLGMDMRVWGRGFDPPRGKVVQPGVGVEPPYIAQTIEMELGKLQLPGKMARKLVCCM